MDGSETADTADRQGRVAARERKRASRACDYCRRQKEKCDGGVPCRRCIRLRRPCEFLGRPTRTGEAGRPAPDSAAAPSQTQRLQQRVDYLERLLSRYTGDPSNAVDPDVGRDLVEVATAERQTSSAGHGSHSSGYLGADEANFTVQPIENNITHYSGEFSHWNFSMRIKNWIEQCVPNPTNNESIQSPAIKDYWRAEELQSPSNTLTSLSSLPPRYVADFLVEVFFKHAEANYFYVERGWLVERLDIAYGNAASLTRRDVGTVCVIYIILAIGTQYAYLESEDGSRDGDGMTDATGGGNTKTTQDGAQASSSFSEDSIGVMFYQQACRLVPDVITIASLESVQACLLIGMYTLPLDASGLSYIYLNLAVKLAIQNGMHRNYVGHDLSPAVRETRNRVWWIAYTTEKRVSIFHGRPLSVSNKDIDAPMPVDRPDLWPATPSAHFPRMLATLQLNQALGTIAQEISILRTLPKHKTHDQIAKLLHLSRQLHKWWDSLPQTTTEASAFPTSSSFLSSSSTRHQPYYHQNPPSRAGFHLQLEYCLVRMFAGHPFIFPREAAAVLSPSDSNNNNNNNNNNNIPLRANVTSAPPPPSSCTSNTTSPAAAPGGPADQQSNAAGASPRSSSKTSSAHNNSSSSPNNPRSLLVRDCVDAALATVAVCGRIRDAIGLARASYTEFSACRAALLVIIARCLQEGGGGGGGAASTVPRSFNVTSHHDATTSAAGHHHHHHRGARSSTSASTATVTGTTTTTVTAGAADQDRRARRAALGQGMRLLREMACGGESAASEASLIEAFESAIRRLDEMEEERRRRQQRGPRGEGGSSGDGETAQGGGGDDDGSGTGESAAPVLPPPDYGNFKKWEMLWKSHGTSVAGGNRLGSNAGGSAAGGDGGAAGWLSSASSPSKSILGGGSEFTAGVRGPGTTVSGGVAGSHQSVGGTTTMDSVAGGAPYPGNSSGPFGSAGWMDEFQSMPLPPPQLAGLGQAGGGVGGGGGGGSLAGGASASQGDPMSGLMGNGAGAGAMANMSLFGMPFFGDFNGNRATTSGGAGSGALANLAPEQQLPEEFSSLFGYDFDL